MPAKMNVKAFSKLFLPNFVKVGYLFENRFNVCVSKRTISNDISIIDNNLFEEPSKRKGRSRVDGVHIVDENVAELVLSSLLKENEIDDGIPIFEAYPGTGILTKKLIEYPAVKKLCVFEPREQYIPYLQQLKLAFPQIDVVQDDIFKIPSTAYKNIMDDVSINAENIFHKIPLKKWNSTPPVKIVGFASPKLEVYFMRFLFSKLPYFESIYYYGRSELLIFISGREYTHLVANEKSSKIAYIAPTVFFKVCFDMEFIDKVPYSAFEPRLRPRKMKRLNPDVEHAYLVRISPKIELKNENFPSEMLPEFLFFVHQCLGNRSNFVIPTLEKWIPDSGYRLIKKRIPVFTKFGELSPEEIFAIFQEFISWPEFSDCNFKAASRTQNSVFEI